MKYFSLFSGIGGFECGIQKVFPDAECVGYSEILPTALKIYTHHFPTHKNFGDVNNIIKFDEVPEFDLLVGGSPCQNLSIAQKNDRSGINGEKSKLFWEYIRVKIHKNPKYFIFENVATMTNENKDAISKLFGYEPIEINSSKLTAQNRRRYFWCNFPVSQPEDKQIYLEDIMEKEVDRKYFVEVKKYTLKMAKKPDRNKTIKLGYLNNTDGQGNRVYSKKGKSVCLTAQSGGLGAKTGLYVDGVDPRKLTPLECEILQGFDDNWTNINNLSNNQRLIVLGNAVTVPVIEHIMKELKKHEERM